MTLTLSATESKQLQRVAALLAAPLEHEAVDGWRSAVNRELRELCQGDTAGFLLPGTDGPLLYSEEHDPDELARYPDFHPPPLRDGRSIWQRVIETRVATMPSAYGADIDLYHGGAYYNEYAAPNGACDTLAAFMPLGGADPRRMASIQVWRNAATIRQRQRFGGHELRLMDLVFPALTAGVHLYAQWRRHRADLVHALDALGQAVMVCDLDGRVVHQTPAMTAALAADPEGGVTLRAALDQAMASAAALARLRPTGPDLRQLPGPRSGEVRSGQARYCLRACVYGAQAGGAPLLLASLERLTRDLPSAEQLRRRFGLTPAESRVALQLARGHSNAEIARALGISDSTARRHTERVFQKLGVRSRAEVGPRLAG